MSRPLYVIRASSLWTEDLWRAFVARAQQEGRAPGPQLAALVRAYVGVSDEPPADDDGTGNHLPPR